MLVLTRKVGEAVIIGDDIEVFVSEIHNGRVSLSISAPRSVSVDKAETRERPDYRPHAAVQAARQTTRK